MGRFRVAGITAFCGGLATCPYLAALSGSPGSLIPVYLTQVPLFVAGLWLGATVSALAGLVGSLIFLVVSGVMAGALFAAVNAVPVLVLVRQSLLARTTSKGVIEWYPPGLMIAWLTSFGLAGLDLALVLLGGPDAVQATLRAVLAPALDRFFHASAPERDAIAGFLALIMPGLAAASWMIMAATNGGLAQGLLSRFGASRRPSSDLAALELPMWMPLLFAVAAAAMVLGGSARFVGINVMIVLTIPFCLAGLAVLHVLTRRLVRPAIPLVAFYVLRDSSAGRFCWSRSWVCSTPRSGCEAASHRSNLVEAKIDG